MKPLPTHTHAPVRRQQQRGVVLFFALVALLAMSLAAVALIRSVDTATLIAGNLSFKRAATTSGDAGIEAAINWLAATDAANSATNVFMDATHPFNKTGGTGAYTNAGYYSNANPNVSLTDGTGIQWTNADSALAPADNSGNTVRYVIQRMCRDANMAINNTTCLFSGALQDNNGQAVKLPQDMCIGPGCPAFAQPPEFRVTSRTTGPKFTVSYVQAFVY